MLQAVDRETLGRICNGDIPASLEADYELLRAGWDRVKGGPMPAELLLPLALKHGGVKASAAVVSDWARVPKGTPVEVLKSFTPDVHVTGTFLAVGEGLQRGNLVIAVYGNESEVAFYPEKRVRVKGEMPKVEQPRKPIPVKAPTKEELLPTVEPLSEAEALADEAVPELPKAGDWSGVKKNTLVDVDTGSGIMTGKFVGVGGEENPGMVAVAIPSIHKGGKGNARKFGWYDADDVIVKPIGKLPIEEEIKQEEASVVTQQAG